MYVLIYPREKILYMYFYFYSRVESFRNEWV